MTAVAMTPADAKAPFVAAPSLTFVRTLAFSATGLPIAALILAMSIHLPAYFATNLGVPLVVVGAVFAICRFIDIPVEPLLGLAMDRTRSRWGRYRVWMLIGAPVLMLGLYMLMSAQPGIGRGYLIVWLLVMYFGMSSLILSHAAWASTLAKSYDDRARIYGLMAAVAVLGSLGVLIVPMVVGRLGYSEAAGVRAMIWYIIVLTPLCVGTVALLTPETIAPEPPGQKFRLRDYLELITHPSMSRILLADLCLSLGPGWMTALFLFFYRDRMHFTTTDANLLLMLNVVIGLFGAPSMTWLATKIGKHRTAQLATLIYSLGLATIPFQPIGEVLWAVPVSIVCGFVLSGFGALIRAMVADVADEIRLSQGRERGGLLFSLTTSTGKIAAAASTAITFPLLAGLGYDPKLGHANSPEALQGLTVAFLAGPIVFMALGAACFVGYRLTAERASEIRRLLDARDSKLADI